MKDLLTAVKEANAELQTLFGDENKLIDEISTDAEKLKQYIEKCGEIATKYHKEVIEQVSLEYFIELMVLDMQYGFIGGGSLSTQGDTIIEIK